MRFATRSFLWTFVPFALTLTGSFWTIQHMVASSARKELRDSLKRTQLSLARMRAQSELQTTRFLHQLGENATLKAGFQLALAEPNDEAARRTMEELLIEMSTALRFDFMTASLPDGKPMAQVIRTGDSFAATDLSGIRPTNRGFAAVNGATYVMSSVEVVQSDEVLGALSVGERFDFAQFTGPVVLTKNGKVLESNLPRVAASDLEKALAGCPVNGECEIRIQGESYLSLALGGLNVGDGYVLRSMESLDAANAPLQKILRNVFLSSGLLALIATAVIAFYSSRSVVRPLADVVDRLRTSANTGALPEFTVRTSRVVEIGELRESFNHAAQVIRESQDGLRRAYVAFTGSLASALDARDRYTAGHSRRVSEWSVAIAREMKLSEGEIDNLAIAALLHDIGKIGISDSVLRKPGKLTAEEFDIIKQHPTIGRRILEGVDGFRPYLPVVELHHENWDGSGYPLALAGKEVPLMARIVHVVDAYDAMHSDRPYRPGMSHEESIAILRQFAGTQFDPEVVEVFSRLEIGKPTVAWDEHEVQTAAVGRMA